MESTYSIRPTLAGIGLLLYGMSLMEEIIKKLMKSRMQQQLEKRTKNHRTSFFLGITATAAAQSSTLVSMLLLIFVGANLISLHSAIAVIVGANIGTTFTSLLVSLLGFGKFSISTFAFPIIAIAGCALLVTYRQKYRYYRKLLISFGLIFLGIDLINTSFASVSSAIDLSAYSQYGVLGFFLVGVIITAIIQSSHTMIIITLAALHAGIITLPMTIGIVIGANLGTVGTLLIAAIGSTPIKKKVALAHLSFNVILSVVGLLSYPLLLKGIYAVMGKNVEPTILIATFNVVLNLIIAMMTMPFLREFIDLINKLVPNRDSHKQKLHVEEITVSKYLPGIPGITLRAILMDSQIILLRTIEYILYEFEHSAPKLHPEKEKPKPMTIFGRWLDTVAPFLSTLHLPHKEQEELIEGLVTVSYDEEIHKELYQKAKDDIETILAVLLPIKQEELESGEQKEQGYLENTITSCIETLKLAKSIREDIDRLRGTANEELQGYYDSLRIYIGHLFEHTHEIIHNAHASDALQSLGAQEATLRFEVEGLTMMITKIAAQAHASDVPLSTILNIDKHISFIHNYYFKAVEAYVQAVNCK